MTTPYLTVIIPTHKRAKLLERALSSINEQNYREQVEVIVVSDVIDNKTDDVCFQLLRDSDIYLRRNGKMGPSGSRNLALKIAKGMHVMFLDDDDSWAAHFLSDFFAHSASEKSGSYYFNSNIIKESRPESGPIKLSQSFLNMEGRLTIDVFVKNQIHMSCLIFQRSALDGISFDTSMRAYEDWDFLLGVFKHQLPTHIPITCSNIYEVDDSTTDRRGSSQDAVNFNAPLDYLYVYRRHAAPTDEIRANRKKLLDSVNLSLAIELL
jgi:glycosyltransferase involved in cell wall biosynthesis